MMKIARFGRLLQRCGFTREEAGNVGLMVSIALPFLVLSIGGGADYARILAARSKLQAATDSATLATYKHHAAHPRLSNSDLQRYFTQQLQNSLRSRFEQEINLRSSSVSVNRKSGKLSAHVVAAFPTTFIRLAGIPSVDLNVDAEVNASINYTEVALVLDTTLSMKGAKLAELKKAATSFLNTIHAKLPADRNAFKVAIVPFAEYVNVGKRHRRASWITVPRNRVLSGNVKVCERWVCDRWGTGESGRECIDGHHEPLKPCQSEHITLNVKWEGCVGSRQDPLNITDGNYSSRVPGVMTHKRNPEYPENDIRGWHDWGLNNCGSPLTPLMTLKDNKAKLVRKIKALRANGFTYIPSGLVWGWRVLSHKAPFTGGASDAEVKNSNVTKVIVLMTDGANTRAPSTVTWMRWADHGSEDTSAANHITRRLCNNIKATNPATGRRHAEIITVTFDVKDRGIKSLMRDCASMGSFDAKSGELTKVFDNIARQLAELHLSK